MNCYTAPTEACAQWPPAAVASTSGIKVVESDIDTTEKPVSTLNTLGKSFV